MENSTKKRRNFLKTGAALGLFGSILSFNPIRILASSRKSTEKKIKIITHPDAVKRNNKGQS